MRTVKSLSCFAVKAAVHGCAHNIPISIRHRSKAVQLCHMMGSSTLNMYRRFELWWFTNGTWDMLHMKLRSIITGLLKGRSEYSSALGPEREDDTVFEAKSALPDGFEAASCAGVASKAMV
jgi:hypothetical protein